MVSVTNTLFNGISLLPGSGLRISGTPALFNGISLLPRPWPSGLSDPYGIQWYFSATAALAFGSQEPIRYSMVFLCYRGPGLRVSLTHAVFNGISLLPRLWPSGLRNPYGIQWYFSANAALAFGSL